MRSWTSWRGDRARRGRGRRRAPAAALVAPGRAVRPPAAVRRDRRGRGDDRPAAGRAGAQPAGLQARPQARARRGRRRRQLLPPRTLRPAGGPPWGLRLVKTSRGLGCVQLGRIREGKLGVLGRDFAFKDDGKFHERGAEVIQQTQCQLGRRDGHGLHRHQPHRDAGERRRHRLQRATGVQADASSARVSRCTI